MPFLLGEDIKFTGGDALKRVHVTLLITRKTKSESKIVGGKDVIYEYPYLGPR